MLVRLQVDVAPVRRLRWSTSPKLLSTGGWRWVELLESTADGPGQKRQAPVDESLVEAANRAGASNKEEGSCGSAYAGLHRHYIYIIKYMYNTYIYVHIYIYICMYNIYIYTHAYFQDLLVVLTKEHISISLSCSFRLHRASLSSGISPAELPRGTPPPTGTRSGSCSSPRNQPTRAPHAARSMFSSAFSFFF